MYEVHSDYGAALFANEQDAVNALFLLAAYHDIKINQDDVKAKLEQDDFFEEFPLSVIKSADFKR